MPYDESGGDERLAGDAAAGVLREQRVQNGIGDLIRHLIRMPFGHRLGGKQVGHVFWLGGKDE